MLKAMGWTVQRENFFLLPPLKTLKNKYDRTNKIQREVIKLPKA
jgi:hypothetical protein